MPTKPEIERELNRVVDAWETLQGGRRYHPYQIADWMTETMKPAMDKARRCLGRKIPGEGDIDESN